MTIADEWSNASTTDQKLEIIFKNLIAIWQSLSADKLSAYEAQVRDNMAQIKDDVAKIKKDVEKIKADVSALK